MAEKGAGELSEKLAPLIRGNPLHYVHITVAFT